ncbi:oligosaccharide flippase family protein [Pseudomonas sp. CrR25]|nr:oligosaccharide flippase family protein [Pseudomonas sp. CrR25]
MSFSNLKKRLQSNLFFRAVFSLASATAAGQLILLLAMPLLTRLYTPDEFGVLAVFTAVMSVILVISSMRYEFAIPLPRSQQNAQTLLFLALVINAGVAVVSLVLIVFLNEEIAQLSGIPELAGYLWLLPIVIFCAGSYKAFNYWAVRNQQYTSIARTKVLQSFTNVITQITTGFLGLGALGLILGQLAGQAAGAFRLARGADWSAMFYRRVDKPRVLALLRKYRRFPIYDVPAAFVNAMSTQLPNLFLAALFNPVVAGSYMLAERALSMPMALFGQAVGQVLFGSSRAAGDSGTMYRMALKAVFGLTLVVISPALVVFFFADDLFVFVFGAGWHEAGQYAAWMIIGLSAQFVYSPISILLLATDGQELNLYIHCFMLLAKMMVVMYGYSIGSSLMAIIGFSVVGFFGYILAVCLVLFHVRFFSLK